MSQKNKNTRLRNARINDNCKRKDKENRYGIRYTSSERTPEEVERRKNAIKARSNPDGKLYYNLGVLAFLEISSKINEKDIEKLKNLISEKMITDWLKNNGYDEEIKDTLPFKEGIERAIRLIKVGITENIQKEIENLNNFIENDKLSKEIILLAVKCANEGHDISKLGSISENKTFLQAYKEAIKKNNANSSISSRSRH